jgi:hypothetical protein
MTEIVITYILDLGDDRLLIRPLMCCFQFATAVDETTKLRLHPECLSRRGQTEADRLIRKGKHAEGLKILIKEYK